jgi:hypothetical protein
VPRATRPTKAEKRDKAKALPVCVAMVLCDQVVVGADRTATVVRIVDTIGVPPDAGHKIGDVVGFTDVALFISLKKGESTDAETDLVLTSVDRFKKRTPVGRATFRVTGAPENGTNILGHPRFRWAGEGLDWLELTAEGTLLAKTPVKLTTGPPVTQGTQPTPVESSPTPVDSGRLSRRRHRA